MSTHSDFFKPNLSEQLIEDACHALDALGVHPSYKEELKNLLDKKSHTKEKKVN